MPYPENKSENYTNFGGMNEKASRYLLGANEFLNLVNFNSIKTGSLTKDDGSTQYISATFNASVYGLYEYNRFQENYGTPSYIPNSSQLVLTTATAAYGISNGSPLTIYNYQNLFFGQSLNTNGKFDFTTFQNTLYACDGNHFLKYNSISAYAYGIPKLYPPLGGASQINIGGLTGYISIATALYNVNGLIGPARFASYLIQGTSGATAFFVPMSTTTWTGTSFSPADYGCTYKLIWAKQLSDLNYTLLEAAIPYDQATFVITTNSFTFATAGFTTLPFSSAGFTQPNDYIGAWAQRQNYGADTHIDYDQPKYLEIFNNSLVSSGLNSAPSDVFISDVGEPEVVQFDSSFEVRTNDGDIITGLKTFFNRLLLFKQRSFHVLTGDGINNYSVTELSGEYGALSNRAICIWEQKCWFLDRRGIAEYNGANVQIISHKMEETFKSMNLESAASEAVMIHVKDKNEVWTCIPANGATLNNTVVIYDYVADAWRKREGLNNPSITLTKLSGATAGANPFFTGYQPVYGGYSGSINVIGQSYFMDNSAGITCIAKSRYLNNLGNSVEKMFRRLYLDADVVSGQTLAVGINFYTNQGTMAVYSATMLMTEFQKRIDFGLSGKDLAVEFIYNQNAPFRINGFTIEYRFQRAV